MKDKTKALLKEAREICYTQNRSTEYMLQFMMDYANVSYECVINYLSKNVR